MDAGDGACDLSRYEGGATAGALVVEKDPIGEVHAVRLRSKNTRQVRNERIEGGRTRVSKKISALLCDAYTFTWSARGDRRGFALSLLEATASTRPYISTPSRR